MKTTILAGAIALFGSSAQADLLTRWEVAEEAISQRIFELYANPSAFEPWTPATRSGKACLLDAMLDSFGAGKVGGYVAHLEATASRRMSYNDPVDLAMEWGRAPRSNQIRFEDVAPLAQACGSSF